MEASRFYDVTTGAPPAVLALQQDGDGFRVLQQFGYRDPDHQEPFVVPADVDSFRSDLTSVPWAFAWLVPGVGTHLPAVLLHDALVLRPGEPKAHIGPDVDRFEADRLLRDGMASLGTPVLRRWLMWTAVTLATCWTAPRGRWWWRAVEVGTIGIVLVLGALATLDLIDVADVLPWMGDRPWWIELLGGVLFALAIPLVLSVFWRHLWRAGAICGIALAFLFHVTLAVTATYGVYRLLEAVLSPTAGGSNARENLAKAVPSAAPLRR